jgi:hypothetical protein
MPSRRGSGSHLTPASIERQRRPQASVSDRLPRPRHLGVHQLPSLSELHEQALRALREADFASAVAPLCRLALAVPPNHEAKPIVLATLAMTYGELGRVRAAERIRRQAAVGKEMDVLLTLSV